MDPKNRVVVLIDMDCFYCQVEEKLNPDLKGKPIAVVQYNPWKGGGIIAVNYVARAQGVTRGMRGDEAKAKCSDIELPSVPCNRGKADITKYRDAGKDVARVLQKFTPLLERASIDEAYLDITAPVQQRLKTFKVNSIDLTLIPNTYALGYESVEQFLADVHNGGSDSLDFDYEHAAKLLIGAVIVSEIRAAVYEETGYRCSAGIAHNKILAKLVCGMNKPNKQTVLPKHSIDMLYSTLPVKKVKHLGGKFGDIVCETLRINKMAELQMFSEKDLQTQLDEKNGTWLYNIAHGIDLEPVQARFNPKSIGCCKQFKGKAALLELNCLKKWLKDLGDEIEDRLEKDALENNRTPRQMVVSYSTQLPDGRDLSSSRSYNFTPDDELCGELFTKKALELLMESAEGVKAKDEETNRKLKAPIKFLGISVGKFEDNEEAKKTKKINDYFGTGSTKEKSDTIVKPNKVEPITNSKMGKDKEYIFKKFFQVTDKEPLEKYNIAHKNTVKEASLDKQESFFAKILNSKLDNDSTCVVSGVTKPSTPVCDVIPCGDESTDTDYSTSTINQEINNSIALFEDEPQDFERVGNLRQLLNPTKVTKNLTEVYESDSESTVPTANENSNCINDVKTKNNLEESVQCSECRKLIPLAMFEEHSDYHFALKLREEERQLSRKENKSMKSSIDKSKIKPPDESKITDPTLPSIAKFFTKLDDNVSTKLCPECSTKVPLNKFTEHLDFHEAQKLSRELNNKSSNLPSDSSMKRKRNSTSPVKKVKAPKCKSIDSFFKQNVL